MDNFTYQPETMPITGAKTNRLDYVDDNQTYSGYYTEDIDDQALNNYVYDKLGQLTSDASDGGMTIEWFTGNRKVKKIIRPSKTIEFTYNPFGQRILKKVTNTSTGVLISNSYYTYDANGQVMGIYDVNLTSNNVTLNELNIYGASRLGVLDRDITLCTAGVEAATPTYPSASPVPHILSYKRYEITNHLGNVNAVISDRKIYVGGTYEATMIMYSDYYPFGMEMPTRHKNEDKYRFGYNGMEMDNEAKGNGNSYTTEFRQYDPRIGRWLSLDPLAGKYPGYSPYNYCLNNPIIFTDNGGDEPNLAQATTITDWLQFCKDNKLVTITDIFFYVKANSTTVPRYIYTEDKGWIDMNHVISVLQIGYIPTLALENASGNEYIRDKALGDGAAKSYYSYEDLPSNLFGHDLEYKINKWQKENSKIMKEDDLQEFFLEEFTSIGAVDPDLAPNYTLIPEKEDRDVILNKNGDVKVLTPQETRSGKYVPQNFSSKPYDLKQFPAASTSISAKELKKFKSAPEPVKKQEKKPTPQQKKQQDVFNKEFKLKNPPKKNNTCQKKK
jgi:RHS repeat-associated protein